MTYEVRRAALQDLSRIEEIYAHARAFMARNGNPTQWGTTEPPREMLLEDIEKGDLYVICEEQQIHGVFAFLLGNDPTYSNIYEGSWRSSKPYGTIHRVAGDGSHGIVKTAVEYGKSIISHLRIDTHQDNRIMQQAVQKQGFQRCGIIYVSDGTPRIAYDLL